MDQTFDPASLRRRAPVLAVLPGAAFALLVAALPQWRLEVIVSASGVADHLAAARPPLGATARSALALASGGALAALVWGAVLLLARLLPARSGTGNADAPVLRRADAHPDAPARRPLRATEDLSTMAGRPLPSAASAAPAVVPDEAVGERVSPRAVPADLDTPLAAVDPAAIPDVPREPVRAVAPLVRPAPEVEDRIETFELTPIRRTQPRPAEPAPASMSLSSLLDRLEQGVARRPERAAPSLDDTLGLLRGLAAN